MNPSHAKWKFANNAIGIIAVPHAFGADALPGISSGLTAGCEVNIVADEYRTLRLHDCV